MYRLGYFLANSLPIGAAYRLASLFADTYCLFRRQDREAVKSNLREIVDGPLNEIELSRITRDVFRNFAKYLVDFFRSSKVDDAYIKDKIKLDGFENIDKALLAKKGVIALSAHIGNWELGGLVLSMMRQPMHAVVLPHKNRYINEFFTRQRSLKNMKPVEIGISLRSCFSALKQNGILAVLGDRDFSGHGLNVDFFGRKALIPKGAAVFSHRVGSPIVPAFMVREAGDRFRFIFEEPIFPDLTKPEEESIMELTEKYAKAIERCVRRYPEQWYIFRNFWRDGEKDLRNNTVV